MKALTRFALAAGAVVGLSAVALPAVAGADPAPPIPAFAQGGAHALFVQTDNTAGTRSWPTTAMPMGPWRLPEPTPLEALVACSTDRRSTTSLRRAR